ncbi:MAG: transporter [Neisseriaceae bacterium]|nr:transporter [Neisseriaceae bacterium]
MQTKLLKTSVTLLALALAQQAAATGYHFGTQSVSSQSTANSSAAEASDASTIFYNPAGLTHLENSQVTGVVDFVFPYIHYRDADANHRSPTGGIGPKVQGSDSGKITDTVTVAPHLYGAYKLNDKVTLGLGVYVPFGSETEYQRDSVMRYNINRLGLTTIAVEPVVSFKANKKHSFGVGLIAQYSEAKLRKYADVGASRSLPGMADAYGEVEGNDWGYGYQLAWMYDVNDRLRLGVNYRSKVSHDLKGSAEWKPGDAQAEALQKMALGAGGIPSVGYKEKEGAHVKLVTPESLSVHGMYRANDKLNLFGDVTWTRHSRFDTADLVFENKKLVSPSGNASDTTRILPGWRNTYKIAVGGSYQINEPWQLRAGFAFDKSPIRNAETRLNTLPDGNRMWFSVGARYTPNKKHTFDVAVSHIHINDTTVNSPAAVQDANGQLTSVDSKGRNSAKFRNHANILGVQYTYKF